MKPSLIESDSLLEGWLQVSERVVLEKPCPPCLVCISAGDRMHWNLDSSLRTQIDDVLKSHDSPTIRETAFTIFPNNIWLSRKSMSCHDFCRLCIERLLPRAKARNNRNRLGTYFERIMDYSKDLESPGQLTHIVNAMRNTAKRPRESMLQLAVYDPNRDLTNQPQRGFPCLQQICVSYGMEKEFSLNALYPVQYIFNRGLGNYLGLANLGEFIAHQTTWTFSKLNVFVVSPRVGNSIKKSEFVDLIRSCRDSASITG